MKKSSCWFKLNIPSLLLLPLPLRTTAHTGGCLGLLGLHWSSRSNLFWSSCPGCSFNHLEYTYWSYGMRHITQVLRTYPVALPARLNECDPWSGGYRLSVLQLAQVMARRTKVLWGPATAAPCQVPRGLSSSCLFCHDLAAAVLFFTALLPRHRLAAKTEHPVQLNQESLPFNSPRTYHLLSCLFLAFILASISSKEITSKIFLVLVASYFITSTQRVPFTITTPITGVMAELRIWCDTCKERAVQEASSSCSNR